MLEWDPCSKRNFIFMLVNSWTFVITVSLILCLLLTMIISKILILSCHGNFNAGSASEAQASASATDANVKFFSSSKAPSTVGGKASLQPKRTPVSKEEIEAILVCKIFLLNYFSGSDISFMIDNFTRNRFSFWFSCSLQSALATTSLFFFSFLRFWDYLARYLHNSLAALRVRNDLYCVH